MALFGCFGILIFTLSSLPVTSGQSNLTCSPQPITVCAGDDVILPCRLEPPMVVSSKAIEWTKPGLDPEFVHLHHDGRLAYHSQNPLFNYRTLLFVDQLVNGNVSLKLSRVKNSDTGKYRCFIPSIWKEAFVQLRVGGAAAGCKDDTLEVSPCCITAQVLSVFIGVTYIGLIVWKVWRWRRNKIKKMKERKNLEKGQLIKMYKRVKSLENENAELKAQKKEETEAGEGEFKGV